MEGGAATQFTGMDASYDVRPDVNVSASYTIGRTQVKPSAGSAFSSVSDLVSDSFFVTATKQNLLGNDSFSVSVGQPTRVRSGHATGVTQSVDPGTGAVSTDSFRQSFVPTGRTTMFQAAYDREVNDDVQLNIAFSYADQPYQQKDMDAEITGLAKLVYKFR